MMMVRTKYLEVTTSRALAVSSFMPVFVEPCKDHRHNHHQGHQQDHQQDDHNDHHQDDDQNGDQTSHLPLDGAPGGVCEMSKC